MGSIFSVAFSRVLLLVSGFLVLVFGFPLPFRCKGFQGLALIFWFCQASGLLAPAVFGVFQISSVSGCVFWFFSGCSGCSTIIDLLLFWCWVLVTGVYILLIGHMPVLGAEVLWPVVQTQSRDTGSLRSWVVLGVYMHLLLVKNATRAF